MKWLLGGVAALAALMMRKREDEEPTEPSTPPIPVLPTGPVTRPVRTEVDRPGRYWTWEELTVSATAKRLGLDNTPGPMARANLRRITRTVLDPIRARYGHAIRVTSGYRSQEVNRAVGGVPGSLHQHGLALDIVVPPDAVRLVTDLVQGTGGRTLRYPGHLHVQWSRPLPYRA